VEGVGVLGGDRAYVAVLAEELTQAPPCLAIEYACGFLYLQRRGDLVQKGLQRDRGGGWDSSGGFAGWQDAGVDELLVGLV